MTRTRYKIYDTIYPHFLTCTVVGWLPIFTRRETVEIILNSWRFLQENDRLTLYGYVILENHLHLIASAEDLPRQIAEFKSFTARGIIDLLEARKVDLLLRQLERLKAKHKTDRVPSILAGREPSSADRRRRDDVAEVGIHPQQSGGSRIRRRSHSLAIFQRTELCRASRAGARDDAMVRPWGRVRNRWDAERPASAFPRGAWERG